MEGFVICNVDGVKISLRFRVFEFVRFGFAGFRVLSHDLDTFEAQPDSWTAKS